MPSDVDLLHAADMFQSAQRALVAERKTLETAEKTLGEAQRNLEYQQNNVAHYEKVVGERRATLIALTQLPIMDDVRHYSSDGKVTDCGVKSDCLSYVIRGESTAAQPEARGVNCPRCLELLTARLRTDDNHPPGR